MSSYLSFQETMARLDQLKRVVTDFVAREQKLETEFRRKLTQDKNRAQAAQEEFNRRTADANAQQQAAFEARRAAVQTLYAQRSARLSKAHKSSQQQGLQRIELHEGRKKYELQKSLLETERRRKQDLAANDSTYADFQTRLAENRHGFVELEENAARAFRGYQSFRRRLQVEDQGPAPSNTDEHQLLEQLTQLQQRTAQELAQFRRRISPLLFRFLPVWLLVGLIAIGHVGWWLAQGTLSLPTFTQNQIATSGGILLGAVLLIYFLGLQRNRSLAKTIASELARARRYHNVALDLAAQSHQLHAQQIVQESEDRTASLNQEWGVAVEEATVLRESWPKRLEAKAKRAKARHERLHRQRVVQVEQEQDSATQQGSGVNDTQRRELDSRHRESTGRLETELAAHWQAMQTEWQATLQPLFAELQSAESTARAQFHDWQAAHWNDWAPPAQFTKAAPFARLRVDVAKFCGALPTDPRLALPGPATFTVPLLLTFPDEPSLLFETVKSGSEVVTGALNNVILRLLSLAPPGRLRFTIIDPVKLGQNFAGVMHLADFEENLINSRIWTQSGEIDQRLADLNDHMEKVIQMYLRNEYRTIADYNDQAGNIAEKYHFLVVADFPVNFSDTAVRRLINIAASGARCGVYTLIHWDRRQPLPPGLVLDELRQNSICLTRGNDHWALLGRDMTGLTLELDPPPNADVATEFLQKVGLGGKNANRVEVPFEQVAPGPEQEWSLQTREELRVPIGRTGATKLQYLAIGKGTRQHALVAGKTGSGKSTLFHVLITNLALWCSPDEVEFYLVDFKKGVEFKVYASTRLPHARVVAIESDREFGLSVLQRVDDELRRRGDLFRHLGVQDLAGYKRAGGTERMPRSLLIIDEFQELFVEDDRISQSAAVLLDRIVRQGRAFGIHVLLGSQTLGGAYTLARTTIGQMVIRIALQCNEADAYLIMDDNNPAPRLLSRPGEGIYNDMAGALEGNSPFQAVWLSDQEREQHLQHIRARADQVGGPWPGPFAFEGNAPGDVRENAPLTTLLAANSVSRPAVARFWLGAPNAIKGPTEAVLQRQSGHHLLLVGQRDEAVLAIMSVGLISLAAQFSKGGARFIYLDSTPPETPQHEWLQRVFSVLPHELTVARGGNLATLLTQLTDEMKRRAEDENAAQAPAIFVFIHGLQNFKKLRQEEDFGFSSSGSEGEANPAQLLNDLICGGAALGIHVIASCDTYNNVSRFLPRKALSEFEMRVLFQMSANDSASLIDSPKASTLGLHRALFYNEHEGYLETFRPYALPQGDWLEHVARQFAART